MKELIMRNWGMGFLRRACLPLALAAMVNVAHAWDGTVSGTIGLTEIIARSNFGFRVWLTGTPAIMCPVGSLGHT